jgi:hypothetical protein
MKINLSTNVRACVRVSVSVCVYVCVWERESVCVFRAQTNNWILLVYFSQGFIDIDRRSIGGCRVRHFLGSVENLLLFLQLFGFSLPFPLLIFPGPYWPTNVETCSSTTICQNGKPLSGTVILGYFIDIQQVHNNTSNNVTVIKKWIN